MFLTQLRNRLAALVEARDAKMAELDAHATALDTENRSSTPDEDALVGFALDELRATKADIEDVSAQISELEAVEAQRAATPPAARGRKIVDDSINVALDRNASPTEVRDSVLRSLDELEIDDTNIRRLFKRHGRDTAWTRNIAARSSDVYGRAFEKMMTGQSLLLSNEERTAMSVGTSANGGYLVPTHLDPSLILTNDGSANAIRRIARVVTLTEGNTWNGVTSAGVSSSWAAELAAATDASPTVGTASIPVHRNDTYVMASIEAFQDINGLAQDILMLFADARDRLEGAAHATGTGSDQPTGIFTALDANTNVEITSTTAATIGLVDLQTVRRAVGQRFRGSSTWLMNPTYGDAIKTLGTALSASYSTDLTQSNTDLLLGRPLVETDDAPETQTTTVRDNEIVFGDFSNYVIVDKPGSTSLDYVPTVVNGDGTPIGARGWVMWNRSGADSVNDLAFRLLQDKTSA